MLLHSCGLTCNKVAVINKVSVIPERNVVVSSLGLEASITHSDHDTLKQQTRHSKICLNVEWHGSSYCKTLADPRGCQGRAPPLCLNSFIFMQFLAKIGQNNRLAPKSLGLALLLWEILDPPLQNLRNND